MPRIDPTAHAALSRLRSEEQRQAHDRLSGAPVPNGRRRKVWPPDAARLAEAKRLIEAIEKLL